MRELESAPELAEQLEAFVSRFGRMQDTIADRLGVVEDVEQWLEARKLRNRLAHEYMESLETFTENPCLAKEYSLLLVKCYNRLRDYSEIRMEVEAIRLPQNIEIQKGFCPPLLKHTKDWVKKDKCLCRYNVVDKS